MRTVRVDGMPVGDGHPPRVMSVLNMSPKSQFRSSVAVDVAAAARMVDEELVPAGADIVDVGLQSANPEFETESAAVELERLDGALDVVDAVESDVPFAVETRYADVAEAAIAGGFDVVNDVGGFADPRMPEVCEDYDVPVVKMASPPDLERPGALKGIDDVFEALQRGGFTDKTIIDPAFGGWYDGKTFEDNHEMFRRLREFRVFGRPILTATNREDFLGALADRPNTDEQLWVSLAAATLEVDRGAHVVRTHDTESTRDVVRVAHALAEERTRSDDGLGVRELPAVSGRETRRHRDVRESLAGDPALATTASFVADRPPEGDVEALADAADAAGVFVAAGADDLFVAGTEAALSTLADDISADEVALDDLVDAIGRTLARNGGV